ncbi:MAG: hypothetical protein MUO77_08455, partial [Anaerolineales bacterium]|nr:hypothetical protein [Anaerolineales bacterium]
MKTTLNRKVMNMKTTNKLSLIAAVLVCTMAFTHAQAQHVQLPKTAADVPGPAAGTLMTKDYVQMVGQMAY